ncbi:MAG: nucleoside monophosphate kinase [Planctomycetota bacterium]
MTKHAETRQPRVIVLLGSPGSGKGTQGRRIATHFGIPHLSTGQMLRTMVPRNSDERQIQQHILNGGFADDDVMLRWMDDRLGEPDCRSGYVLDGFPRTVVQAIQFDQRLSQRGQIITAAILLQVSQSVIMHRLRQRQQMEGRRDDREAILHKRMELDQANLGPLTRHYQLANRLLVIDGEDTVDAVTQQAMQALPMA